MVNKDGILMLWNLGVVCGCHVHQIDIITSKLVNFRKKERKRERERERERARF